MTAKRPVPASLAALVVGVTVVLAVPIVARAQMQLPGALNGNVAPKAGGVGSGGEAAPPPPPKPIIVKPPGEEMISGKPLSYDGTAGTMIFDKTADGLVLSKLVFVGDKISRPGETCSVDVSLTPPLAAKAAGRPAGAIRFDVPVDACPFAIDVLEGAALVSRAEPSCEIAAADCRISPGGLWGPKAADIPPKQIKDLERERVRIETTMRANFRVLLRKAGKDRAAVKAIAREQAAFSSEREVTCRDYDQESVHGFCSTQVTEARALALVAQFGEMPEGPHGRKRQSKAKPKVRPAAPAAAAPAVEAPAPAAIPQ